MVNGPSRAAAATAPRLHHDGDLCLDPVHAPGVLDTATWDPPAAILQVQNMGQPCREVATSMHEQRAWQHGGMVLLPRSIAHQGPGSAALLALSDGQHLLLSLRPAGTPVAFAEPLLELPFGNGLVGTWHAASADALAQLLYRFAPVHAPANAPRALGAVPRLGIGTRMTTAVWPGAFRAMARLGFAANAIQNSVRELNLLGDLREGRPPVRNYACGFGTIEAGYTGSTFEGLWLAGTLAALSHDQPLAYGSDADHIQPKRDDPHLLRAKRTISAARNYTFFTLDVSDILDYAALKDGPSPAGLHRKYDAALETVRHLLSHLHQVTGQRPVDIELSIDEHPPEVPAFDCLTSDAELAFVLERIRALGLPVSHIAPNLGIEKGQDYRHPSGLAGLEVRTRSASRLCQAAGIMLDIHSADDLSSAVRARLRSATGGRIHYKISPSLQLLFATTLLDHDPALFQRWWEDALSYAQREAAGGSAFAQGCLGSGAPAAQPGHPVFHHFSFAFPGRRSGKEFLERERFYRLAPAFYRDYADRVEQRLTTLATDLF